VYLEYASSVLSEVFVPKAFLEKPFAADALFPSREVVGGFPVADPCFSVNAEGGGLFAPTCLEEPIDTEVAIVSTTPATLFSSVLGV